MKILPIFILVLLFPAVTSSADASVVDLDFTYCDSQALPSFQIDGKLAKIHTQGLLVTKDYFLVTGRLESSPKRALLVRYKRSDPSEVDYLDITPKTKLGEDRFDHPGGFDFDGKSLWIPISASKPTSKTQIVRVSSPLKKTLKQETKTMFIVDDHIGALAFDRANKIISGANWDTKIIYQWSSNGELLHKIPRNQLVKKDPHWALAVQDWKSLGKNRILAGGIDKSAGRDRSQPTAVVELLDISRRTRLAQVKLPSPAGYSGNLTREGMAVWEQDVFFLPADLEDDAEIYRYRRQGTFSEPSSEK